MWISRRLTRPVIPRSNAHLEVGVLLTVIGAVAITLGLVAVLLPWWLVVSLAVVPVFVAVVVGFPEVALALVIATYFGLFPEFLLPRIPLFGGRLAPEDLGVIGLLTVLSVRHIGKISMRLRPLSAYAPVFFLLAAIVATSVAISLGLHGVPRKDVLNELRPFFAWLILPLCWLAVDSKKRLRRFLNALLLVAILLAIGVMFQSLTGIHVLSKGQFMELGTLGNRYDDVTRSTTPGMFLIGGSLIYLIALSAGKDGGNVLSRVVLALIMCGGILVGFGRGLWVSVIFGLILVCYFMWGARCLRVMLVVVGVGIVAGTAAYVAKPEGVQIAIERATSIGDELRYGASYGRRKTENHYAFQRIGESPLLGVGLGAEYKPPSAQASDWAMETRYIHNSYLNAATKLGIPGFVVIVLLVGFIVLRSWRAVDVADVESKPLVIASLWVILATGIITSFTQPNLLSANGVVSIAVAVFFVEIVLQRVLLNEPK